MRLLDSRRLTGPNLMLGGPAVIAEVGFDAGDDPAQAIAAWRVQLARMLEALGWSSWEIYTRVFEGGAALVFTAPLDVLLPATEVNDWAVAGAAEVLVGRDPPPLEPRRSELASMIEEAKNPRLLALREEARARQVPFLLDDKALTLGMTGRSATWPRDQLPAPESVAWESLGRIPLGLITGTNGKTTSTRLVARMAREAGLVAGATSTEGVAIDGKIVESGDYTGPAGALAVLRRPEVQLAVLETARGGILRRGLAVDACDAALITNVSADHLGDYGVDDVRVMAQAKAVIASVAKTVVLNAGDATLVALAPELEGRLVYFAFDAENKVVAAHRAQGGEAWFFENGAIMRARGAEKESILPVTEIPVTFGGRARYNVENALGAAALASALGLSDAAIVSGLRVFTSSAADNPGRGNIAEAGGVKVLVDFGHNPAGVRSVLAFARTLIGAGRIIVISGMPGDRLDREMREVAREIAAAHPHQVILRELHGYLRGRNPGAVPEILKRGLLDAGLDAAKVDFAETEVAGLARALDALKPGDLIAILPSLEIEAVRSLLAARGAHWW